MADGKVTIDTDLDTSGVEKEINTLDSTLKKGLSSFGTTLLKGTAVAITGTATAVAGLTVQAVQAYGTYEQLAGGIETLFGAGSMSIDEYAQSVGKSVNEVRNEYDSLISAQEKVFENAANAYKTAGLSANDYMETVTSFSASLVQSLAGDTELAAEYADRAIVDMSDNANKMGTDMQMLQNAYQGFAKQNYTMLDNLKLGYGGTKTEMERLIADASQMVDIQNELNVSVNEGDLSFANIVNAISVMQESMGIAGTTAKEATETIEGSINSMKASWNNLVVGLADDNADLDLLIDNFIESLQNVMSNITPVVEKVISSFPKIIDTLIPEILNLLPTILDTITILLSSVFDTITNLMPGLIPIVFDSMLMIVDVILENLPLLDQSAHQIVIALSTGLADALPELIPAVVATMLTIVQNLLDNLNMILDAGLQIMVGLTEGLLDSLPIIIEALPKIIVSILNFFVMSTPSFIDAGIKLFTALVAALPDIIATLNLAAIDIIIELVNAIINSTPEMMEAGKQLVNGLWEGIKSVWDSIVRSFEKLCNGMMSRIKRVFGIHSPSKEFAFIGKMNAEGLSEGFEDEDPMSQIEKNIQAGFGTLQSAIQFDNNNFAKSSIDAQSNNTTTVKVILEGDARGVFKLVRTENNNFKNANGGRSAFA